MSPISISEPLTNDAPLAQWRHIEMTRGSGTLLTDNPALVRLLRHPEFRRFLADHYLDELPAELAILLIPDLTGWSGTVH